MSRTELWKYVKLISRRTKIPIRIQYKTAKAEDIKLETNRIIKQRESQLANALIRQAQQVPQLQNPSSKVQVADKIQQQLSSRTGDVVVMINNKTHDIQDRFVIKADASRHQIFSRINRSVAIPYETNGKGRDPTINDYIEVYLSTLIDIQQQPPQQQRFREGETNCLITPIINAFEQKYEEFKDKVSIRKRTLKSGVVKVDNRPNKTAQESLRIIERLQHYQSKFHDAGVSVHDIQEICNDINISIKINDIIDQQIIAVKPQKNSKYAFEFVNTKTDHVDEYFGINTKQIILPHNDFVLLRENIKDQSYVYDISKGNISRIYHAGNTYIHESASTMSTILRDFKATIPHHYNRYSYDQFNYIAQFATINSNIEINRHLRNSSFTHIDQETAYANFKACDYYIGFPSITDIRKVPQDYNFAIQNIGLYLCTIQNTQVLPKYLHRLYSFEQQVQKLTSPEIKFLVERGAVIKLISGAYGKSVLHLEFTKEMINKREYMGTEIRPFALLVGTMLKTEISSCESKYIHTPDDRLLQFASRNEGAHIQQFEDFPHEYRVWYEKPRHTYKSAISTASYITAYQRLNMCQQLELLDFSKVYRIVTDGIYTTEQNPVLRPTFRTDKEIKLGFECGSNYIIQLAPQDFHTSTEYRDLSKFHLCHGVGGSGKTHDQLSDLGLLNIVYVAPSNKLSASKRRDYKELQRTAKFTNYTLILSDATKYLPANIVLDECMMFSAETVLAIQQKYPHARIICCGDEAQLIMNLSKNKRNSMTLEFQSRQEYTRSIRCKDEKLRTLQNEIRQMRLQGCTESEQLQYTKQFIKQILDTDIQKHYDIGDMILVSTHDKKREVNASINAEGYKYRVNHKCKINDQQYYNGDIIISNIPVIHPSIEETHSFVVHSIQGETFTNKIFLSDCRMNWAQGYIYTAITRAQYLDQLVFVQETYLLD